MINGPRGHFGRKWRIGFAALIFSFAIIATDSAQTITQNFQTTGTPTNWAFDNSSTLNTFTPLSGQAIGTTGTKGLELSNNTGNTATAAQYTGSFSAAGASVYTQFNYQMYGGTGGTTNGGDGITFFLYDGTYSNPATFSAGAYGGSMGYAQKTGINGLSGGYIGVGLDAYGNFSSASEGRVGGYNNTTGQVTESIAVRGPGSGTNGYAYLGGTSAHLGTGNATTNIDSGTNPSATTNTVQILLSATNQLTVTLAQGGSTPQTVLQLDLSGYTRPDTLSFGFTAGSGGATDYMFVNNLTVTTLAASRWTNAGGTGNWGLNTNWNPSVVPTSGSDILFDNSSVNTSQIIDTAANRTVRSITFDAPFDYTVNNNTFTLNNGGIAGFSGIMVTQTHGTGTDTIGSALSLGNAINVRNNATGVLNLNGAIATNGNSITFDGSGTSTNVGGAISGTGAVLKNDVGTVTLTAANSYSGGTTINNGTLNANNAAALGSGGVTLAGGTLGSTNSTTISKSISLTADSGMSGITNGGTLTQVGANRLLNLANVTQSGAVNLSDTATGHTLTVNVDAGSSTISGAIGNGSTGTGNVTKTGSGTLVLSGTNTYSGTTTISNGNVQLGGNNRLLSTSNVSIDASGTLDLNGFSQKIGTLTALNGGATLDFGATGTANNFVFGTYVAPTSGVLVVNNWETGNVDHLASTRRGQAVGTIYISGFGAATESGTATTVGTYGSAYLLTPAAQTLNVWDGSSSGTWSTGANWSLNSAATTGQIAVFDSTGGARTAVTLNANYTVAGVQFGDTAPSYTITGTSTLTLAGSVPYIQQQGSADQAFNANLALNANSVMDVTGSGNLTLGGNISGTHNLIRDGVGDGRLILSGTNTFSGGVFINNGIVQAVTNGTRTVLGNGATTVSGGATLELSGTGSLSNNISVAGTGNAGAGAIHNVTGTNSLTGTVTETADITVAADTGSSLTLAAVTGTATNTTLVGAGNITVGPITTGAADVIVNGTGTVTFNGAANTYTGNTTVNSGSLVLAKAAGTTSVAGNLVINGGAVQLGNDNQVANTSAVTLNGTGLFDLNGHADTVGQLNSTSGTSTVSLGATGALTVNAINSLNSSYAGAFTGASGSSINLTGTGKLNLSGSSTGFAGAFNVNGGTLNVSSSTALGSGTVAVSSGGNFQLQGGISFTNTISIAGTGTSSNGALENFGGNNSLGGAVNLTAASVIQSDSGLLTLNGPVGLGGNALTIAGNGNTAIGGVVSGTGGITKTDIGTLSLSGSNTYSGGTTIGTGIVAVTNSSGLGTGAVSVSSGAALQLGGGTTVGNGITASGTGVGGNGAIENTSGSNAFSNTITLGAATRIQSDSGTLTFNGTVARGANALTIGGAGSTTINGALTGSAGITKTDGGTLTLGGSTGMTGALTVSGGTLALAASNAVATSATLSVASGATISLGSGLSQSVAGLTNVSGSTITIASNGTLTVNTAGAQTLAGNLNGAGTLAYTGGGSLTVASTTTLAGNLSYTGTGNITLSNNVSLNSGTLLVGGTGGGSTTTVHIGGVVSLGTLHITGNTILDFGNSTATSLTASQLLIDTGVTVSVVNWVNMSDYFIAQNFAQYNPVTQTQTSAIPDVRGTTPENQVTFTGYSNNQTGWVSFDHEITPAPEPATYGAIFIGAALGLVSLRRWRQRRHLSA